jgi:hypothetical protein
VSSDKLSAPPTTAASQTFAAISWAASPKTFALDEHAVETVKAGPRNPRYCRTNSVVEKWSIVCR